MRGEGRPSRRAGVLLPLDLPTWEYNRKSSAATLCTWAPFYPEFSLTSECLQKKDKAPEPQPRCTNHPHTFSAVYAVFYWSLSPLSFWPSAISTLFSSRQYFILHPWWIFQLPCVSFCYYALVSVTSWRTLLIKTFSSVFTCFCLLCWLIVYLLLLASPSFGASQKKGCFSHPEFSELWYAQKPLTSWLVDNQRPGDQVEPLTLSAGVMSKMQLLSAAPTGPRCSLPKPRGWNLLMWRSVSLGTNMAWFMT